MKFLIDTNILIPAEPTSPENAESQTPIVTSLLGLIAEAKFEALIHPDSISELAGDTNDERRTLRTHLLSKYVRLPYPPSITSEITDVIGVAHKGSHDEIDDRLLTCVARDAVDYLITGDRRIHRKASRLGITGRVLYPSDAVATVRGYLPVHAPASKTVTLTKCHNLNEKDAIFESIRGDYKGFDEWLSKAKLQHRDVFLINTVEGHAAIAIVKEENPIERGFPGKTLKICTFKVAEHARGYRYGELLLSAIFDYMDSHTYEFTYLTCYRKQDALLNLLRTFGFYAHGRVGEELVMAKCVRPTPEEYQASSPHQFNVQFGPRRIKTVGATAYVIPIQPRYHAALFPELEKQASLFDETMPFGNSILKAYLCRAPLKATPSGSILLFYRSGDSRNIRCVGVADGSLRSSSKTELMRYVGQRTVYTEADIDEMCAGGSREVLAILFRQARTLDALSITKMVEFGALKGVPQSITTVKEKARPWLNRLIEV